MLNKTILSIFSVTLLGASTIIYADNQVCIKADTYYRLNYVPGSPTHTTINPGMAEVTANTGDSIADWSGNPVGNVPDVPSKHYLSIAADKVSVQPLTGSCGGAPGPGPAPTPAKTGAPALPSTFTITQSANSASRKPSIGKEYASIQYNMWWGYQTHYLDVYQDGVKLCLPAITQNGVTSLPKTCDHSYTFPNYEKDSQAAQAATLEFGPTTITKHEYHLQLTNDAGQTTKDFDINLAGASGITSVIRVTADPASAGKTTADTDIRMVPNIIMNAANTDFKFDITDSAATAGNANIYKLAWSNPDIFSHAPTETDANGSFTVSAHSLAAGRSSLRITDSSGNIRYIGFTIADPTFVKAPNTTTPSQRLNDALPPYIAMGSMTEDNTGAVNYWRHFNSDNPDQNRRVDIRYIYLNQWSNGNPDGWAQRETTFLDNGLQLGQMPFFVEYNVNGGQDSQQHIKSNLQDKAFMGEYFTHLAQAATIAHKEAGNTPVGFIIEPDMLGYMLHDLKETPDMQTAIDEIYTLSAPIDPSTINVPYSQQQHLPKSQTLVDKSKHNFPDTLKGFVQAVNYVLWKYSNGTAVVGWQMNLWASPDNSGNGIIHSDLATVIKNAKELAQQGQDVGIRPAAQANLWDNSFVSIDKYGLDGAGAGADAANKPAESSWFWNAALYDNYLAFASNLAYPNSAGVTNLPIILWQLPVGHLNGSHENSPYTGVPFKNLQDVSSQYEGSAAPYFLGANFTVGDPSASPRTAASNETVNCGSEKMPYFACPDAENGVSLSGSDVTWKAHMQEAANAHVAAILFGAGIGSSTHGHPLTQDSSVMNTVADPDTEKDTPDDNWFIYKLQQYYKTPVKRVN